MPAVSIICIYLNGERFLGEAIDSVLAQDRGDWELLLVDDGSTDRSAALARFYAADDRRIRCLAHPGGGNRGMSAARNLGLAHAQAPWIAFIDADDRWRPGKLEAQLAIVEAEPRIALLAGTVNYWGSWEGRADVLTPTGHRHDCLVPPPEAALALYPLGAAGAPCPSDVLVRRDALAEVGGFEDQFTGSFEDCAAFGKIFATLPVWFSSEVWLDYRIHADSSVAGMIGGGHYPARRRFFLRWYRDWLRRNDVPVVARAVRRRLVRDRLRPATYRHTAIGRLALWLRGILRR
ncbi:glycosyltransferase family 2 protein [Croceibacterium ferulae]|uniref:glycosyltransferase family 2 protein n=1 Tax=Croceibacterium ferulae TaxID=1854641 RepID=UPI0013900BB1|nr:glycosyltransferase family 2 protein [Croceibacterium ferulae]